MKKFILIALLLLVCRSATMAQDVYVPYHIYQPRTTGPTRQGGIYYNGTEFRQVTAGGDNPIGTGGGVPANMMTTDTAQVASGQKTWTSEQIFNLGLQTKNSIRWDGFGLWADGTTSAFPQRRYQQQLWYYNYSGADSETYSSGWGGLSYDTDTWFYLRRESSPAGLRAFRLATTGANDNSGIIYTHNATGTSDGVLVRNDASDGGFNKGFRFNIDSNEILSFFRNTSLGTGGLEVGSSSQSVYTTFYGNPFAHGDRPIMHVIDASSSFNTTPINIERTTGGNFTIQLSGNTGTISTVMSGGTSIRIASTSSSVTAQNNAVTLNCGTGRVNVSGGTNARLAGNTNLMLLAAFPGTYYIGFGDNLSADTVPTLGTMQTVSNIAVWSAGSALAGNPGILRAEGRPTDNKVGAVELQDDNTGGVESVFLFKREGVNGIFFHTSYPTDPDTQGTQLATGSGFVTLTTAQTISGIKTFSSVQGILLTELAVDPSPAAGVGKLFTNTTTKLPQWISTGGAGHIALLNQAQTWTGVQTFNEASLEPQEETHTAATPTADSTIKHQFIDASSNTVNLTLPAVDGMTYRIKALDVTNAITITPASGTIDGAGSYTGLTTQYDAIDVYCDGTNFHIY